MLQSAKALARQQLPGLYRRYVRWNKRNLPQQVTAILASNEPPRNFDDEALFDTLQRRYEQRSWPDYNFDHLSVWKRAVDRAASLLANPPFQPRGLSVLEAACGDGMTGKMLASYGHRVTLHDLADWRVDEAQEFDFFGGSLCSPLPAADGTFDVICSYNSFEHVEDPRAALAELVRITKPGGHILLDFCPLYACPLGLHATTLNMPYPQFLFSERFYERKRREVGGQELEPPPKEGETAAYLRLSGKFAGACHRVGRDMAATARFLALGASGDLASAARFLALRAGGDMAPSVRFLALRADGDMASAERSVAVQEVMAGDK